MIAQVKNQSGTKTLKPISGAIPTGNPVGSLLTTYKKLQPRNYLYCDGSTFNAGQYPALYLYLGTNVLPDYRECAMVGAEENTTDNIATHDIYAQGEFKDDQFQGHEHNIRTSTSDSSGSYNDTGNSNNQSHSTNNIVEKSGYGVPRYGETTHGKQKAVYVYIKAVDGVDIADEDTFLDTVKNFVEGKLQTAQSYSTTETWTGGYWIDGKKIYRMCGYATGSVTINQAGSGTIPLSWFNTNVKTDVDKILKVETGQSGYGLIDVWRSPSINTTGVNVSSAQGNGYGMNTSTVVCIEYTKTTD